MQSPRLSHPTLKVLRMLLDHPSEPQSGADIARATKLGSGTLYPLLNRLEKASWLLSEWETAEASELGRPRKRFYRLSGSGRSAAHAAFEELDFGRGQGAWIPV